MTTQAHDSIRCPGCGATRLVTHRQRRRATAEGGILCTTCRGGQTARNHKDSDLRYWLEAFGATPAPRTPAREIVTAGGAPPELVELARAIFPR